MPELVELQQAYIQQANFPDENVAAVLFVTDNDSSSEDQLLDALDSKYDALRDKLIAQALMQQVGTCRILAVLWNMH